MNGALQAPFSRPLMRHGSITRRISLLFALISFVVIAAMGYHIDRMLHLELLQENDLLLLASDTDRGPARAH